MVGCDLVSPQVQPESPGPRVARWRLRLWSNLDPIVRERLFATQAEHICSSDSSRAALAAMGGTIYVPASREDLTGDLLRLCAMGITAAIVDLEDSVRDGALGRARQNVLDLLRHLSCRWAGTDPPMAIFLRVRVVEDMVASLEEAGIGVLAGFVVPKCDGSRLDVFATALASPGIHDGPLLMPVVETIEFAHANMRHEALACFEEALENHREKVLAVRFGAVDLAGAYGTRRNSDMSVYDVPFLAAALGDLVSVVSAPPLSIPVTGSVHEFYNEPADLTSALVASHGIALLPALAREVMLDRASGLWSKSVVHPTQALIVNALSPVGWSDYQDARNIVAAQDGGADASYERTRMNEARPHGDWAASTLTRARACGVLREGVRAVDLMEAGLNAARSASVGLVTG
jgi:citrate lyase beta subunit